MVYGAIFLAKSIFYKSISLKDDLVGEPLTVESLLLSIWLKNFKFFGTLIWRILGQIMTVHGCSTLSTKPFLEREFSVKVWRMYCGTLKDHTTCKSFSTE